MTYSKSKNFHLLDGLIFFTFLDETCVKWCHLCQVVSSEMSNGVKWSQVMSSGVEWCQGVSSCVKWSQMRFQAVSRGVK
jgi:hypothetical protein